jgi:large subunit ribosomal protein L18
MWSGFMLKKRSRVDARRKRHDRVRTQLYGTRERPRMCVFRSNKYIYVQIIDDTLSHTLVSASTQEPSIKLAEKRCDLNAAKFLGGEIAQRALKIGIVSVVFDRAGYSYHGKVKALADAARESGLKF